MKRMFSPILCLLFLVLLMAAKAEPLSVMRAESAYNPSNVLAPATILSPQNFEETSKLGYVVVEGYIDYFASAWPEDDGDYHFEMQNTKKLHDQPNPVDGLVGEIDPTLRLDNAEKLRKIKQDDPTTYRKARVYGWVRFGTERNHAGVQDYDIGGGTIVNGHWEIHPVEKIEIIDDGPSFSVGPDAEYVKWPTQGKGTIAKRYKVNDDDFADAVDPHTKVSNYAKLIGNVKHIKPTPNDSGDLDVDLEVNSEIYIATIPQYCIKSFDENTETVKFQQLQYFKLVNYTLKPSDSKVRIFYGLRNWKFHDGKMFPIMAPVEMIK